MPADLPAACLPPREETAAQALPPPALVLDSNAVLDWLLFADAALGPLGAAIVAGRCRWLVSPALRGELEHVLARGLRSRPQADAAPLWQAWERWSRTVADPPPAPPAPGLRCTDGDDQKFLDLALAQRARWLVSRDRALLKLRRRVLPHGLHILTPAQWALAHAAA